MFLTRITTYKNPDRVTRKVLLDTDRLKEKVKELPERIEELNEYIDNKIDGVTGWLCDLVG